MGVLGESCRGAAWAWSDEMRCVLRCEQASFSAHISGEVLLWGRNARNDRHECMMTWRDRTNRHRTQNEN